MSIAIALLAGCWHSEPQLKPPPQPERYDLPPTADSRFDNPVEYPKGALNSDLLKKNSTDPNDPNAPASSRFGAGPGGGTRGGG
jgi:hypothetical protein